MGERRMPDVPALFAYLHISPLPAAIPAEPRAAWTEYPVLNQTYGDTALRIL